MRIFGIVFGRTISVRQRGEGTYESDISCDFVVINIREFDRAFDSVDSLGYQTFYCEAMDILSLADNACAIACADSRGCEFHGVVVSAASGDKELAK